jgi:PKD repeat protein
MKKAVVLFLFSFHLFVQAALAQKDLPNPPADIVSIPAGSYVIPMDTNLQNIVPPGQAPFNLKAYGLINEFLQNKIPVRWAIASGKNLNDIDFTAMAEQVFPSTSLPSMMDFYSGPFIVYDTSVCGRSTYDIIQDFGNDVAVYRLTQSVAVDVRYKITHNPKIAIFINGSNQQIHSKILDSAGINSYDFIDAANIGSLVDCYTFASEPHWDIAIANQNVINGVKNFVLSGGNFFAQCKAVETYENLGFFMSNTGISLTNIPVSHSYHNADMAAMQIHGTIHENQGGAVSNWTLDSASFWGSQTYKLVTSNGSDTVIAMGAHLTAPQDTGGNVFFVGCHDYMTDSTNLFDLSEINKVNELRMYLNSVFIPSIENELWAIAGNDKYVNCAGSATIGCSDAGPPGSTFTWSPATGLSCTNCPEPVASPVATTSYILTVTGANGCIMTDEVTVTVTSPSVANFAATTVCENNATVFTDQSTGAAMQWSWSFGDGNTSTLQNPMHVFTSAGTYQTALTVTDSLGCTNSTWQNIIVYPIPQVDFNTTAFCQGIPVCFTDISSISAGTISTWSWNFGDSASGASNSSAAQSPCHTYSTAGVKNISLTLTSGTGCQNVLSRLFTVSSQPQALFSNTAVCENTSTSFTDQSIPAPGTTISSWVWQFGDGTQSANLQNPSHLYASAGQRNVTLIVANQHGCSDTTQRIVTVHRRPIPDFVFPVSGCESACATITDLSNATEGIITSWQWNFPGGAPSVSNARTPSVCYNTEGNYSVTLNLTSSNGCTASLTKGGLVNIYPLPVSDFCVSTSSLSLFNPTANFCELWSNDVVKWYWDFGDGSAIDSVNVNPSHTYSLALTGNDYHAFTASLMVENIHGCMDVISKVIEVMPEYSFFIPNCFTPNDDFLNRNFYGKGSGIKEYEISIYDRWGLKIWNCSIDESDVIWDNNPDGLPSACKWDGSYNGSFVQEDVYIWKVNLRTILGRENEYIGKVVIIK